MHNMITYGTYASRQAPNIFFQIHKTFIYSDIIKNVANIDRHQNAWVYFPIISLTNVLHSSLISYSPISRLI